MQFAMARLRKGAGASTVGLKVIMDDLQAAGPAYGVLVTLPEFGRDIVLELAMAGLGAVAAQGAVTAASTQ